MWIVLWLVVSTSPVECPDFKPDPYTGAYPSTHCAVYHCKETKSVLIKEFVSDIEAKGFIDAAPKNLKDKMKLVHLEEPESSADFGTICP